MNRAVAMEMIQRQLDGDLTQEELIALEEQIRIDSELQLFRQRLQRVSADLHSLPRMTPPFSLVDAILPKLEAKAPISLVNHEQPLPSIDHELVEAGSRLDNKAQPTQPKVKKRLPVWLGKSAIGAVAACLLLGLFSAFGAWKTKDSPGQIPDAGNPSKQQPFVVAPKTEEQNETEPDVKKNPDKKTEQKQEQNQDKKTDKQPDKKNDKKAENQTKKLDSKGSQSRPGTTQKKEKTQGSKGTVISEAERNKEFLNNLREYVNKHKNNSGKEEVDWEELDDFIKKSIEESRKKSEKNEKEWRDWEKLEKKINGKSKEKKEKDKKNREDRD